MRKIIGMAAIMAVLAGTQAFGFGIPGFGGDDKKDSAATVDVKSLTKRDETLKTRVNRATVSLASGVIEVQHATGRAAEAAKLQAVVEEAKKNPSDIEATKTLSAAVDNAVVEQKKIDLNAAMNKAEAKKRLGTSLLHLGAGTLTDMKAANDAKKLMTDITNSIKVVQASPMKYGMSAVSDLQSALGTTKFVAEAIPTQVSSISELTKGLVKYANTNKIPVPSAKEQEKQSAGMEKE